MNTPAVLKLKPMEQWWPPEQPEHPFAKCMDSWNEWTTRFMQVSDYLAIHRAVYGEPPYAVPIDLRIPQFALLGLVNHATDWLTEVQWHAHTHPGGGVGTVTEFTEDFETLHMEVVRTSQDEDYCTLGMLVDLSAEAPVGIGVTAKLYPQDFWGEFDPPRYPNGQVLRITLTAAGKSTTLEITEADMSLKGLLLDIRLIRVDGEWLGYYVDPLGSWELTVDDTPGATDGVFAELQANVDAEGGANLKLDSYLWAIGYRTTDEGGWGLFGAPAADEVYRTDYDLPTGAAYDYSTIGEETTVTFPGGAGGGGDVSFEPLPRFTFDELTCRNLLRAWDWLVDIERLVYDHIG